MGNGCQKGDTKVEEKNIIDINQQDQSDLGIAEGKRINNHNINQNSNSNILFNNKQQRRGNKSVSPNKRQQKSNLIYHLDDEGEQALDTKDPQLNQQYYNFNSNNKYSSSNKNYQEDLQIEEIHLASQSPKEQNNQNGSNLFSKKNNNNNQNQNMIQQNSEQTLRSGGGRYNKGRKQRSISNQNQVQGSLIQNQMMMSIPSQGIQQITYRNNADNNSVFQYSTQSNQKSIQQSPMNLNNNSKSSRFRDLADLSTVNISIQQDHQNNNNNNNNNNSEFSQISQTQNIGQNGFQKGIRRQRINTKQSNNNLNNNNNYYNFDTIIKEENENNQAKVIEKQGSLEIETFD